MHRGRLDIGVRIKVRGYQFWMRRRNIDTGLPEGS